MRVFKFFITGMVIFLFFFFIVRVFGLSSVNFSSNEMGYDYGNATLVKTVYDAEGNIKDVIRTRVYMSEYSEIEQPLTAEKYIEEEPTEDMETSIYYNVPLSDEVQDTIITLCAEEIDPRMVFAIINHESGFTSDSISATNDYGLMQINDTNHKWLSEELGITDFLDPIQNVTAGIYILSLLVPKYDDLHIILMCYAAGEYGAKNKWFSKGIYSTEFSRNIIADMKNYELR